MRGRRECLDVVRLRAWAHARGRLGVKFLRGQQTVGEGEKFLQAGGVVAFVIENRRVRFDIDQSAAARAMLTISSRLMSVARTVEK